MALSTPLCLSPSDFVNIDRHEYIVRGCDDCASSATVRSYLSALLGAVISLTDNGRPYAILTFDVLNDQTLNY